AARSPARDRRRATRPAARRGDRKPLEGGGAVGGGGFALATGGRGIRRGTPRRPPGSARVDDNLGRDSARKAPRLQPRRPRLPPLRDADRSARTGRGQPHRLLVPQLPGRGGARNRVGVRVAVRAPHLYRSLRLFGLASFALLAQEVEAGAEIQFSFEEHDGGKRPLYEYRPLVGGYVEARAGRLAALPDALTALEELRREPAAAIFARAHAGGEGSDNGALIRTVLLPLLTTVAEHCGGFDWNDEVFDRVYGELERSLFGSRRAYAAVAPLIGLGAGSQIELGRGIRVRVAAA